MAAPLRSYYLLVKPGIVYGNAIHTIAGALFAVSVYGGGWIAAIAALFGTSLIIASACIVNNYGDRSIDAKMKRTQKRPSVTGDIPLVHGVILSIVLVLVGSAILLIWTNPLTWWLGVVAYVFYTVIYAYEKRRSPLGTLVGTIPGALPAVAGYVAVSGEVTVVPLLIGLLLVAWQMVHFYAIAIYRKSEYANAGVPVITVKKPFVHVRKQMIGYEILYIAVIVGLLVEGTLARVSLALILAGAIYWLVVLLKKPVNNDAWARKAFGVSLILSLVLCAASIAAVALA